MFSKQLAKFKNETKIKTSWRARGPPGVSGGLRSLRILCIGRIDSEYNNVELVAKTIIKLVKTFHTHTQTHTHARMHTHTHTHTHTHVRFCEKWGHPIGVMVFILYKLYVLLPYTYPIPKLSPHRRLCISTFPQKTSLCMIYKRFEKWGHGSMS